MSLYFQDFFGLQVKNLRKFLNISLIAVGSLIYIKIRNDIFDNFQTTLSNIDIDSDNYQDLLSLFIQRYDIYANTDGIITIIAFFSFIRYISRVSGLLNCYFEMIVQVKNDTFQFFISILVR